MHSSGVFRMASAISKIIKTGVQRAFLNIEKQRILTDKITVSRNTIIYFTATFSEAILLIGKVEPSQRDLKLQVSCFLK